MGAPENTLTKFMQVRAAGVRGGAGGRWACAGRLARLARYHLIVPLKRSRHPPDYVARSVAVGLFWALTPTVGVQMAIVLVHWLVVRRLGRWDFNAIHAMVWTWVTNFFTLWPFYYTFYVTGQIMLGRWDDLTGYRGFLRLTEATLVVDDDWNVDPIHWFDTVSTYADVIFAGWGLALLVGSIPYAALGAWLGYAWTLRFVTGHRQVRLARRLRRHAADGARDAADSRRPVS